MRKKSTDMEKLPNQNSETAKILGAKNEKVAAEASSLKELLKEYLGIDVSAMLVVFRSTEEGNAKPTKEDKKQDLADIGHNIMLDVQDIKGYLRAHKEMEAIDTQSGKVYLFPYGLPIDKPRAEQE